MLGNAFTLPEVMARCPYRTVFGSAGPGVTARNWHARMPMPSCIIAVLGGEPVPISAETMAEIIAILSAGDSVMILADRADLRDYAKREIAALAGQARGHA